MRSTFQSILGFLFLCGCVAPSSLPVENLSQRSVSESVLDVSTLVQQGWRYFPVKGHTDYRIVSMGPRLAIQATGAGGAGGLIRRFGPASSDCSVLRWTWRIDAIQASANLSGKSTDDVAASIFVLFGDPGFLSSPNRVPTVRYVWTSAAHERGQILDNPYFPKLVKNIVVRAGNEGTRQWLTERRDLASDFRNAYGREPDDGIGAIAIFTDNDQTKEPVRAYYHKISIGCHSSG